RGSEEADREGGLPRAALADDGDGLALLDIEGHVAHGVDRAAARAVIDREVADGKDRRHEERRRGLKMSSSAFTKRTSDSCNRTIARIGLNTNQNASRK